MVQLKLFFISSSVTSSVMFQFLNGSIKAKRLQPGQQMHLGFNSSMVQLKPIRGRNLDPKLILVSIPQWFN